MPLSHIQETSPGGREEGAAPARGPGMIDSDGDATLMRIRGHSLLMMSCRNGIQRVEHWCCCCSQWAAAVRKALFMAQNHTTIFYTCLVCTQGHRGHTFQIHTFLLQFEESSVCVLCSGRSGGIKSSCLPSCPNKRQQRSCCSMSRTLVMKKRGLKK